MQKLLFDDPEMVKLPLQRKLQGLQNPDMTTVFMDRCSFVGEGAVMKC